MKRDITVRKGKGNDLPELQTLFVDTITSVCSADYNAEQIKIWASGAENKDRWREIITTQEVFVAESDNKLVGFATLKNRCYIDLLYVHNAYQRQNIARRLYAEIENLAIGHRIESLTADVSITARPFFERMGFVVIARQTVVRQGVEFINFKMRKETVLRTPKEN